MLMTDGDNDNDAEDTGGAVGGEGAVCDGTQNVNDTDTFFRYQIFSIPIPVLFSGTKFFRYRNRYFFPVPNFSDTGSDTTKKNENSRYREFPVPVRHTLVFMILIIQSRSLVCI